MRLRVFEFREIEEAVAYAAAGGFAVHLHRVIVNRAKAPRCFVQAVDRGEDIAHLFGQDEPALVALVRRLGVKVVVVERRGTPNQHVDLVGGPLRKAIEMAARTAAETPILFEE